MCSHGCRRYSLHMHRPVSDPYTGTCCSFSKQELPATTRKVSLKSGTASWGLNHPVGLSCDIEAVSRKFTWSREYLLVYPVHFQLILTVLTPHPPMSGWYPLLQAHSSLNPTVDEDFCSCPCHLTYLPLPQYNYRYWFKTSVFVVFGCLCCLDSKHACSSFPAQLSHS